MIRGTTPTFTFTLPFNCSEITKLNIAFSQEGNIVVEKNLGSCSMSGKVITAQLTEQETLLFKCNDKPGAQSKVEIQLRVGCGTQMLASQIMTTTVGKILKDGCL